VRSSGPGGHFLPRLYEDRSCSGPCASPVGGNRIPQDREIRHQTANSHVAAGRQSLLDGGLGLVTTAEA
jgi:hypothetical protein